jgi:hypothetical protein
MKFLSPSNHFTPMKGPSKTIKIDMESDMENTNDKESSN